MATHSGLFSALVAKKEVTIRIGHPSEVAYLRVALNREKNKYNALVEPIMGEEACIKDSITFKVADDSAMVIIRLAPRIKKQWEIVHAQES